MVHLVLPYKAKLEGDAVGIVEMLYVSSTVAVVGTKEKGIFSPKRVTLWDTNQDAVGAELSFMSQVISVRLNQTRMLVGLEGSIFLYDYELKEIAQIKFDSALIKYAMSPTAESPFLAHSTGITGEDIAVYDINSGKPLTSFKAHDSPVYYLTFNERGTLLASASTKGSIITVFGVPKGEKIYRLKRGFLNAQIISMVFSHNSTLFGITSTRGTLHIYQLERSSQQTLSTGPPDPEELIELQERHEKVAQTDTDDDPGCSACSGLTFLFSKLAGTWCWPENGSCHSLNSIIKKQEVQFKQSHIMGIYENGKVAVLWNDGKTGVYSFNIHQRTIEKTASGSLVDLL